MMAVILAEANAMSANHAAWVILGALAICFAAAAIPMSIIAWKDPSNFRKAGTVLTTGDGLRFSTVLAIVFAVVLLSLAGEIDNGVIALLSGIAGYVLGGLKGKSPAPNEE